MDDHDNDLGIERYALLTLIYTRVYVYICICMCIYMDVYNLYVYPKVAQTSMDNLPRLIKVVMLLLSTL